eukprot:TCONS_00019504-protein
MDTVKFGRTKIKVGDCVSVSNNYFGNGYLQSITDAGLDHQRIYGRVTSICEGNRNFAVKWDFDQEITYSMSLEKVQYEQFDTPLQAKPKTVITAEDFEGLAGDQEQCSASKAAETHALLYEDFAGAMDEKTADKENLDATTYTLFVDSGKTRKNCLLGRLISSADDSLVHGKKLTEKRSKFLITKVLDNTWKGFDADFHTAGAFVAWDKDKYFSESIKPTNEAKTSNETKSSNKGKHKAVKRTTKPVVKEHDGSDKENGSESIPKKRLNQEKQGKYLSK